MRADPLVSCGLAPRGGAAEDFVLTVEGEWAVNPTLLHALRTDFAVEIDTEALDDLVAGAENMETLLRYLMDSQMRLRNTLPSPCPSPCSIQLLLRQLGHGQDLAKSFDVIVASPLICAIVGRRRGSPRATRPRVGAEIVDPDHILLLTSTCPRRGRISEVLINAAVAGADRGAGAARDGKVPEQWPPDHHTVGPEGSGLCLLRRSGPPSMLG